MGIANQGPTKYKINKESNKTSCLYFKTKDKNLASFQGEEKQHQAIK